MILRLGHFTHPCEYMDGFCESSSRCCSALLSVPTKGCTELQRLHRKKFASPKTFIAVKEMIRLRICVGHIKAGKSCGLQKHTLGVDHSMPPSRLSLFLSSSIAYSRTNFHLFANGKDVHYSSFLYPICVCVLKWRHSNSSYP